MTFTPTEEQQLVIAEAKSSKDNLQVSALAGAAKTSTLVLASQQVYVPTLSLAFNKKIAEEMAARLPGHVASSTMNSLGHRAWGRATGKRLVVKTDKTYDQLREYIQTRPLGERNDLNEIFAALLRSVRLAKSAGYVPEKARTMGRSLVEEGVLVDSLLRQLDVDVDDKFLSIVDELLLRSIAASYEGMIDFDDQLYMSTLFGGDFTRYPLVMVDEAQDLSPLNHEMLQKVYGGRLIAVGDPNQAIYGFRGAHTSSMQVLKDTFSMRELALTISFRCPQSVVRHVQSRVPHMRWPEWAEEGHVEALPIWDAQSIPDFAAIVCRNNGPLFACAMRLIRAGRGVHILGNDVGAGLLKLMKKIAPTTVPREQFVQAIAEWRRNEIAKAAKQRHASINDRAECLRVFADIGQTSDEAYAYAEHLFRQAGPIQMMTGHKAKGLEFDIVYHLDPALIPSIWARRAAEDGDDSQLQQEYNLQYVINTRAKKELYFINLEDML